MIALMDQFLVVLIVFIVVITGGMLAFSRLASKMVTRAIQERLHALQEIVEGGVPHAWLRPFRRRVVALRRHTASTAQRARLGKRIQKHCLRNLEEMLRYVTNVNLADSETTHKQLIADLKAQQQTWLARDEHTWIAHVEALDVSRATEEEQTLSSAD
jgi:hypothetical protein